MITRSARLPSSRKALAALGPFLESFPEIEALSKQKRVDLRVVVGELVTNAILHGNRQREDLRVDISICVTSDEISIIVRDYGEGFLPEAVPDPRQPDLREQPGGRGIFLTKQLAKSVLFERVSPGMQVTVTFLRS